MLTTDARQPHRSLGFRQLVASTACAAIALIADGVTRAAAAEDRAPSYDRRALSEIARDVLRLGAARPAQSRRARGGRTTAPGPRRRRRG